MIILGIDPGVADTGWGVIKKEKNNLKLLTFGVIKTPAQQPLPERLSVIYKELKKTIKKFQPDEISIEELFFCKNVKTALLVGQARGVILLTAIETNVAISEFTPLQVKQAVAAYGKADKKQIQKMVKTLLNMDKIPHPDDAADALAIAICAANSAKFK